MQEKEKWKIGFEVGMSDLDRAWSNEIDAKRVQYKAIEFLDDEVEKSKT